MRLAHDALLYCDPAPSHESATLSFGCGETHRGDIRWTETGDALQLMGTFDGAHRTGRSAARENR